MNLKEIIERCNNMIKRLAHTAYGEQNPEAIKDIEALDEVISALEKQEADRWILVTEKMPEEYKWIGTEHFETTISDEVYVTIEVPSGERITKHMCFQNGSIPAFKQRSIDAFYKGGKVVAWKPLPEPYQEDKA